MDAVTAAILVLVVLLAVGIVADQLFRLRDWLNRTPPNESPERGDAGPEHRGSNSD